MLQILPSSSSFLPSHESTCPDGGSDIPYVHSSSRLSRFQTSRPTRIFIQKSTGCSSLDGNESSNIEKGDSMQEPLRKEAIQQNTWRDSHFNRWVALFIGITLFLGILCLGFLASTTYLEGRYHIDLVPTYYLTR